MHFSATSVAPKERKICSVFNERANYIDTSCESAAVTGKETLYFPGEVPENKPYFEIDLFRGGTTSYFVAKSRSERIVGFPGNEHESLLIPGEFCINSLLFNHA